MVIIPDWAFFIIVPSFIGWSAWVSRNVLKMVKDSCFKKVETQTALITQKLDDVMDFWKVPQRGNNEMP